MPSLLMFIRSVRRAIKYKFGRKLRPAHNVSWRDDDPIEPFLYWFEEKRLRIVLPISRICWQGSNRIDAAHPFVRAIHEGPDVLDAFYRTTQPQDICDLYGFERLGDAGETLPPWELPWLFRIERAPPGGENGLDASHGNAFYGPCTPEKVRLEHRRLTTVRNSIARYGYDPESFGDVEGHFLRDGDRWRFFVRGGKHRVAAMASLGHTEMPVSLRQSAPRVIDARTIDEWPLVASGAMSERLARRILDYHLNCE